MRLLMLVLAIVPLAACGIVVSGHGDVPTGSVILGTGDGRVVLPAMAEK